MNNSYFEVIVINIFIMSVMYFSVDIFESKDPLQNGSIKLSLAEVTNIFQQSFHNNNIVICVFQWLKTALTC